MKILHNAHKYATFYAKVVTTIPHHWEDTNRVVKRNRKIGVSQTGIVLEYEKDSIRFATLERELYNVVRAADKKFSTEWGVPCSIRVTTIKPEGTLSLLLGVPSGMHFPPGQYYERRMKYMTDCADLKVFEAAGLHIEPDQKTVNTMVVSFPVKYDAKVRKQDEVPFFEQMALNAMLQNTWSDNSISFTGYYAEHEVNQVKEVIATFLPQLKTASFLMGSDQDELQKQFPQLPIYVINEEEYNRQTANLKPLDWSLIENEEVEEVAMPRGCEGDRCTKE